MIWDDRYKSTTNYVFGTEPNDFLREQAKNFPAGKVLCLGDGEGRNGVWLAQQGFDVLSVDASWVGLEKARKLAEEKQVDIATRVVDLKDMKFQLSKYSAVVSVFCHMPADLRAAVHRRSCQSLLPGGYFLLEAYAPGQEEFQTGGPSDPSLYMSLDQILQELEGVELVVGQEITRDVIEGSAHTGKARVLQLLVRKL